MGISSINSMTMNRQIFKSQPWLWEVLLWPSQCPTINPLFGSVVSYKNRVVPWVKHLCFVLAPGPARPTMARVSRPSFQETKKTAEPSSETATAKKDDSGNILAFMFSFRFVLCWGGMLQNVIPRGFLMMRPICRPHKKEETKYVYIQYTLALFLKLDHIPHLSHGNFSWVFPLRGAVSSSQLVERNVPCIG